MVSGDIMMDLELGGKVAGRERWRAADVIG